MPKGSRFASTTSGLRTKTILLDSGVPVQVVTKRCGHEPSMLLKVYAKRTGKADVAAANVIGTLTAGVLAPSWGRADTAEPPSP